MNTHLKFTLTLIWYFFQEHLMHITLTCTRLIWTKRPIHWLVLSASHLGRFYSVLQVRLHFIFALHFTEAPFIQST